MLSLWKQLLRRIRQRRELDDFWRRVRFILTRGPKNPYIDPDDLEILEAHKLENAEWWTRIFGRQ